MRNTINYEMCDLNNWEFSNRGNMALMELDQLKMKGSNTYRPNYGTVNGLFSVQLWSFYIPVYTAVVV